MTTRATTNKFSPEVRERAVRMVLEHAGEYPTRWAAVVSIAAKIGCAAQTLHEWTKKAEVDGGKRAGVPSEVTEKLRALERENRELEAGQRDPAQGVGVFCPGGARPPVQAMIAFIDEHRGVYGVEPICKAFCRSPHRPITIMPPSVRDPGPLLSPRVPSAMPGTASRR